MADDKEGDSRGEGRGRLWHGLKTMIFGEPELSLRDQIEDAIDEHEEEGEAAAAPGDLTPVERLMLRNLLQLGERTVDDVKVPRADIVAIPESISFPDLVVAFAEAEHSRLPVYRESLDHIIGMIHIKDMLAALAMDHTRRNTTALLRAPLYVPQAMGVLDLLAEMRQQRTHLAIVIDEYSGTEGLVTIEDLVEEIVGEIEDEHDEEAPDLLVKRADGGWDADARALLTEVGAEVSGALAEVDEDVDTLGGLAFVLAGHVPAVGEIVTHPSGWRLEITEGDERRVTRLRLHAPVMAGGEAPAPAQPV
jgi:CBS domain containing-hemolysin-like protein